MPKDIPDNWEPRATVSPGNASPQDGPGLSRQLSSSTFLAPTRGRFISKQARAEHYRRLRHGLDGNEPFCDPEGLSPIEIMGRCALKRPWLGGKGLGYAERDVR